MTLSWGARLIRRRFVSVLAVIAAAVSVAIGLTVWPAAGATAATIPSGARVLTVTPVFGQDPNLSRHHLDHAFTITDPARIAKIAAIIDHLAPFPINVLSCTRGNNAAMRLTFRASRHGRVLATVLATYTGCPRVWNLDTPDTRYLEDYTSSGQQLQHLVLTIAHVRWPYTPTALPPLHA
jgi:hypothetical protein